MATELKTRPRVVHVGPALIGMRYPKTRWVLPAAYAIWLAPYVASGFVLPDGLAWWLARMVGLAVLVLATASGLHLLVWRRWSKRMTPEVMRDHFERAMRARYESAWLN